MERLFLTIALLLLMSCNEAAEEADVLLPANLEYTLVQSETNPANVELQMSAENTNFFSVDFGDGSSPVEETDGDFNYLYPQAGTYTVTIKAHATAAVFISATEVVTIAELPLESVIPSEGFVSPESYAGMTMVWRDEFDGEALNTNDWTNLIGDGCPDLCGWGNEELQFYTRENTTLTEGHLIITAKRESRGGKDYTSSRLSTKGKQSFQYGRIDIRAALPKGQGIWPALWMLGNNIDEVGWPASGEIDIMEMIGGNQNGRDDTVHGTVHWFGDQYASFGGSFSLPDNQIFNGKFHVFSITWDAQSIRWYVDNEQYHVMDITSEQLSEFRQGYYFLFNVAVGGRWPGSPDAQTSFPQHMVVDYIRVFQDN